MINGNPYDALTINGIKELFAQNFQGQVYKLQIVQYFPSADQPFLIFLSDGYAQIKGQLVGEAKNFALKNPQLKINSVIEFFSDNIEINEDQMFFRLKKITAFDSKVHNIIGKPQDYKKKGFLNETGTNNIMSGVKIYTLKQAKQLKMGTIKGHIIAKVIKKPDKISSFLNILIEDEEKSQIQCCFFGKNVDKYHPILIVDGWYRFEDPVLQMNNRQGGALQLKINDFSNVVKHKNQTENQEIGFLKANVVHQNNQRFKPEIVSQTEFLRSNFQGVNQVNQQINYFIIAKVVRINTMKDGASRSLHCKDFSGNWIEITIWKEFQQIPIAIDETYKFRFMKAKIYKGIPSLQSRKNVTKVEICQQSITFPQKKLFIKKVQAAQTYRRPLPSNEYIKGLKQTYLMMQNSDQKVCYGVVFGTMIYPFQFVMSTTDMFGEMRKKLFYLNCQLCDKNDYRKAKIEPQIMDKGIVCSLCKSLSIILFWNLKVSIVDSEMQISCKVNNEIAQKLLNMTAKEGMIQFLKTPERIRKEVHNKLNLFSGVFKINSKLNQKREGQRFYNICEYYPNSKKVQLIRIKQDFQHAVQIFNKYSDPDQKVVNTKHTVPSYFKKKEQNNEIDKKVYKQKIEQQQIDQDEI